jgi:hypothetical protein
LLTALDLRGMRCRGVSRGLRPVRLHLQRERPRIAGVNGSYADHMLGKDDTLRIADLNEHRVLARRLGGRMVNRALNA